MNKIKQNISKLTLLVLIFWNFNYILINTSFASKQKTIPNILSVWIPDTNKLKERNKKTDWIIVKFKKSKLDMKSNSSIQVLNNIASSKWLNLDKTFKEKNISLFKLKDKSISLEKTILNFKKDANVESVQANYIYYPTAINSNDTHNNNLWWFDNFWQSVNSQTWTIWADISWNKAINIFSWSSNISNTGVIVAVLDSWVAYNHPDLINQMWDWSNCKNENWVFLGSCSHGYDFADNDTDPRPKYETHWTHVAWIIASQMNNSVWITWVNPNAKIMALRMWDSSFTTLTIIKSIYFAKENGAKIINASFWASWISAFATLEYQAIADFTSAWWLFIAAAGNNNWNNDNIDDRFFPASFWIDNYIVDSSGYLTWSTWAWITTFTWITNIISVAATDNKDNIASFSNYWAQTVNIWAPWVSIYSSILWQITTFSWVSISNFNTWWLNNKWWNLPSTSLRSDIDYPYATLSDTYIQKQIDISNTVNPNLDFSIWCDAWSTWTWTDNYSTDYMSLEFSSWWNFVEYDKYNYTSLSLLNYSAPWFYWKISIPLNVYKSSDFTLKFKWHTDNFQNAEEWCFIYDLSLYWTDNNWNANQYEFLQWTSMAAPYVAWLASLAWSYKPGLSWLDIKQSILNNWDQIASMSGTTSTWKRINAFKTLLSLTETWSITDIKAYSNSWKTLEYNSWTIINTASAYLEWTDSTNNWAIEKYKIDIKDWSWNLLDANIYTSWSSLNSKNNIVWTGVLSSWYTWTILKYVITPVLFDWREWWSKEININYDNINPIFSNISYLNWEIVSSSNITLNWTIVDTNLSWSISINWSWVILNWSWVFSQNINLNPWLNHISLSVYDKAWNNTSSWIDLIRIGTSPITYSSITWTGFIKFEFDSEFAWTWIVLYWTGWNLNNTFTWSYWISHIAEIPFLNDEEVYYYRSYFINNWYDSLYSATWSIKTPKKIDLTVQTGSISYTWNILFTNASWSWIDLDWTWSIKLFSQSWTSHIEIPRNWVKIISSSWAWDWIIEVPYQTVASWIINLPGYTRLANWTFKIWSNSDSLSFSWWSVSVNLDVWNSLNWKIMKIYRSSDNQSSFTYVSECTISAWICSFTTNNFSVFTLLDLTSPDSVPDNFSFTSVSSSELNTAYTSNTITVTWINTSTWITTSTGTLIINWIDSPGQSTVSNWNTVAVRINSSASYSANSSAIVTIWWVSSTYTVTTKWTPVAVSTWWGGWMVTTTPTCLDSQLICKNWVYETISWISCISWNLWKICSLVSTGTTNTWVIINSIVTTNNLKNLIDKINSTPSLNKTYYLKINDLKDISNHYSKKYVDVLINKKIINWYSDKTFRPDNNITRAEYLSILMKAFNIAVDENIKKSSFTDIEYWSWQIKYAQKARDFEISNKSTQFRPNDTITRAEALSMLFKISWISLNTNSTNTFSDTDTETWMSKYINKAKSIWLVSWEVKWNKKYFYPNNNITRAESVKITVKLLNLTWR